MTRFFITLAYLGTGLSGFQDQPGKETVQTTVERALEKVLGEKLRIIPSGRTDKGVHAIAHPAHFDVKSEKALARIHKSDFLLKLNAVLPDTIVATSVRETRNDFHARKSADAKEYTYLILLATHKNPFWEDRVWRISKNLDVMAMKKATRHLLGTHDFSSFCASDAAPGSKIKTIKNITIHQPLPAPAFALPDQFLLQISFIGDGFLKQMVRSIVGTLVEIGLGRLNPEHMKAILNGKDRKLANRTAPAQGLHLVSVKY